MERRENVSDYGEKERTSDFEFFIAHYDELYRKYGHKFIVIRNQEILGVYEDVVTAVRITSETYPVGTFIVQECTGDESGYTNYISSWQLVDF